MSSHHFVKEGQEPALLITGKPRYEVVSSLLEWAPLVIVAEDAIDVVLSWEVKIDVAIVSEKTLDLWKERLSVQAPVSILSVGEDGFIELTLQFLIAKRQSTVSLLADATEDLFLTISRYENQLNCLIYSDDWKFTFVKTGEYNKWLPSGENLKLFNPQAQLRMNNVIESDGILTVINDGFVKIESNGPFWIAQKII